MPTNPKNPTPDAIRKQVARAKRAAKKAENDRCRAKNAAAGFVRITTEIEFHVWALLTEIAERTRLSLSDVTEEILRPHLTDGKIEIPRRYVWTDHPTKSVEIRISQDLHAGYAASGTSLNDLLEDALSDDIRREGVVNRWGDALYTFRWTDSERLDLPLNFHWTLEEDRVPPVGYTLETSDKRALREAQMILRKKAAAQTDEIDRVTDAYLNQITGYGAESTVIPNDPVFEDSNADELIVIPSKPRWQH